MSANSHKLLPSGFEDILPPRARLESHAVGEVVACFEAFGFGQVKPPLLEYRETLHAGMGETISELVFETQDPLSAQTLCLRADITVQVARIAANQLAAQPRPLRLSYAGQIVRRYPNEERVARQNTQAGIEIIGLDGSYRLSADVEAIRVATTALKRLGIEQINVDLTLPSLVRDLTEQSGLNNFELKELQSALDRRDIVRVRSFNNPVFERLLELNGEAKPMIAKALKLEALVPFKKQLTDMAELIDQLTAVSGLDLTVDFCEQRGTAYHQAVGFNFFAKGHPTQLGAGGRYANKETLSTGATLYLDSILPLLGPAEVERRIQVPLTADEAFVAVLQNQGWVTNFAVKPSKVFAVSQGCTHFVAQGSQEIQSTVKTK